MVVMVVTLVQIRVRQDHRMVNLKRVSILPQLLLGVGRC